ncbi:Rap/ran-GAP family protein [Trichomonas vaginalis G3]|uniref:Rap/ran-GAP family protein n=1 Tax=Trichomonas vaginalis (strain ATCC PRA-98 / G3) TaxID=412133 RepID=A2DAE7_TRIV3|nr:GTPase activator protein [Trichomonas vaginalis G3]EAY22795.1 Rap/ran-GAP family protein [Trichomonas vaginalis G3]KAI5525608.1 GTPase activator protein [Trichomonas vaginalis G3]|eukprot:XP_001583781.1 Rap/ran-GAP family protein [Trichomonas vaginalis G3]
MNQVLGPQKKQVIQDISKTEKIFQDVKIKSTVVNDYLQPCENYISALSKLLAPVQPSKFGNVQLQLADYFVYAATINTIIQDGLLYKIAPSNVCEVIKVVLLFTQSDVTSSLYLSIRKVFIDLLETFGNIKPTDFKLFEYIKQYNYLDQFGTDLFGKLLLLSTEKIQFILGNFPKLFEDERGKQVLQVYFKSFIAAVKAEQTKPQFVPYNAIYILIEFLRNSAIEIPEPLAFFRYIWAKITDENDKIELIQHFEEIIPSCINSYLPITYILYLYDSNVLNPELFSAAYNLIDSSNNTAQYFITFLACLYFFDITTIDTKALEEFSNSITTSTVICKTMAANLVEFHKGVPSLINTPWKYANTFFEGEESTLKFENLGFDAQDLKKPYDIHNIDIMCDAKSSSLSCLLINRVLDIFELCPSALCKKDPKPDLCWIFIPRIFAKKKLSQTVIKTFTKIFSDPFLQYRISNNVYKKWVSFIITQSFNDKDLVLCTAALADIIRLNLPCASVAAPFFLVAVNKIKSLTPLATNFANAFASLRITGCISHEQCVELSNTLGFGKKYSNSYMEYYSDISNIYNIAPPENRPDVFAAAIQALVEDSLRGRDYTKLKDFIISRILQLTDDEMQTLSFLSEVDQVSDELIISIVDACLAKESPRHTMIAVRLMVSCPYIRFNDYLPHLKGLLNKKGFEDPRKLFLENFLRYPFKAGMNFIDDHFDMKNEDPKSIAITSEKTTIITNLNKESNSVKLFIKSESGNSQFVCKSAIPTSRHEIFIPKTECDIPHPVYDDQNDWGDKSTLKPFNALPETLREVSSPLKVPVEDSQHKEEDSAPTLINPANVLQAFGYIDPLKPSVYRMLDKENASNELKALFDIQVRSGHKVAVIYVGYNQRDQEQLLANTLGEASPTFYNFIKQIGYPIDLANHPSFTGGLDNIGFSTGRKTCYYANMEHELMWHVSTLIETALSNGKNIYKKRHIGNDSIHVLWSEDLVEYDISMITSQFNHAHIVIYPLPHAKFAVHVFQKTGVKWFGSLRGKSVISAQALPAFIRYTAIEADVLAREFTAGIKMLPSDKVLNSRKTLWEMTNDKDNTFDQAVSLD